MDIKKLLENYNEFLFADGYIIDQQLGVIDERAISDFLTAQQVKNLSLGNVLNCKHPRDKRVYIGTNLLKCTVCSHEFS